MLERVDAVVRPPVTPRAPRLAEHWPLTVLLAGYPVWWLLGLDSLLPLLAAVPMATQLLRRRGVHLPRGVGWWVLFALWVALGVTMLWVDAPGAVPGGGTSRLLVFGFRLAWYVACGVVLVWVANLRPSVPDRTVQRLLAWMFVVCVAGGLLGLLAPTFEIRSLTESLLPGGVRSNQFVRSLVHPQAADVQTVLGRPETRPKAPFPFTNTWGSSLSISLVFFVALLRNATHRVRLAGLAVLVVAAIPVVYSLNRGLWASIALGVVGVVVLLAVRGRPAAVAAAAVACVAALVLFLASPLGDLYQQRLDHQHSNGRRGQLLEQTVTSVTSGSPVLGFGTTRDVEGSFASITGAATPECPACGVPPLGTQGQLWLVIFSQGWFGLVFFIGFVVRALARSWRCRTVNETACTFVIAFFVLQLPVYDTLGLPLYLVMVAVGLVAREQRPRTTSRSRTPTSPRRLGTRTLAVVLVPTVVGATAGSVLALTNQPHDYAGRVSILITPAPVYLATGARLVGGRLAPAPVPREITVDTEAAMLKSQQALSRAAGISGTTVSALLDGVSVTAPPRSQVLDLVVVAPTAAAAQAAAEAVAGSYLDARRTYLDRRRDETLDKLRDQLRGIGTGSPRLTAARSVITSRINRLVVSRPTIGRVIRREDPEPVGGQPVVPVASGGALGLLVGILLLRRRLRDPVRTSTTKRSTR